MISQELEVCAGIDLHMVYVVTLTSTSPESYLGDRPSYDTTSCDMTAPKTTYKVLSEFFRQQAILYSAFIAPRLQPYGANQSTQL